ncbi:MAG: hypothetical protein ABUL42_02545 [Terricaulis silvestris]
MSTRVPFWKRQPARRRRGRAAIAFVVAPVFTALAFSVVMTLIYAANAPLASSLENALQMWTYGTLILGGVSLTFGWMFHAAAFRLRWRAWATYMLAGAAVGAGIIGAFVGLMALTYGSESMASALVGVAAAAAICGVIGAVTSTAFWFIRRPDRDVDTDTAIVFE